MNEISILNSMIEELSAIEFEKLIYDIVKENFNVIRIQTDIPSKDLGFDILAETKDSTILVEVKKRKLIGIDEIHKLAFLWKNTSFTNPKIILAISGSLTEKAKQEALKHNIEIWDIYDLYKRITPKIENKHFYGYSAETTPKKTKEEELIERLNEIPIGSDNWQKEWSKYQKLVSDILEHLLSPPLEPPRFEDSDLDKKNRRDIIFENSSDVGFWSSVRTIYKGDYIVVDAKNYKDPIEKKSIIELAHYLKPYGCGLFGLIVSRKNESDSAFHARKEQWIGGNKMILTLSDEDLIEMLNLKRRANRPEEIIRRKIADFRMKL